MKNKLLGFLKKSALPVSMLITALIPFAAYAAGEAPDFTSSLLAIWKAIQDKSGTALILVPIFQLLRTNTVAPILGKLAGKSLTVVIAIITTLGYVAEAWAKDGNLLQAAITGLFVAGGATLIYDAIRSIKPEEAAPAVAAK